MAKKKKRKSRKSKKKVLTKWHIALPLVFVSFLFFFSLIFSPDSLAYLIVSFVPVFFFGKRWTFLFFAGMLILGLWIIYDETILKKSPFKKFFILLVLLLPIFSFPLLYDEKLLPSQFGWNLWYLILYIESKLFSWNIKAIELFSIILFVSVFILLFWKTIYNLFKKIPKFELAIKSENEKDIKNDIRKEKTLFNQQKEKIKEKDKLIDKSKDKQLLKQLIKQKIEEKLKQKEEETQKKQIKINFPEDKPTFDVNLLESPSSQIQIDEQYLIEQWKAIEEKLAEFNIPVKVEGFNIWPTVLQIKVKPEAGISISKIEQKKKDLAMALKAKYLRILAPIPWTEYVGIEIPNPNARIVRLKELLDSTEFAKSMQKSLTNLAIWISIDWKKIIKPLEKMPHLLVAGATGSGKSVGINDFILSLIYQNTPSELKFIMVDPKQVELGIYEWIPYLLAPIITDPEKAVKVLKWAVGKMEERYSLLKEARVRNIDEYNKKVSKDKKLPRIVIIIDELADLMMSSSSKKDTETAIARIAQKARAVWMHLIVATQRPSVNVITGLIKANIPTRIAFGVISQVDSRTILDMKWAEDLMWKWDLLYIDPTTKFPLRVQAPFVSTEEVDRIVEYLRDKYMQWLSEEQVYDQEIINILNSKAETVWGGDISEEDEELVQKAIEIIKQTRKASATLLQRKLGIWFARAARIMDILEERWIVWPQQWAKPREIYI